MNASSITPLKVSQVSQPGSRRFRLSLAVLTLTTTAFAIWLFLWSLGDISKNPATWLLVPLFALLVLIISFSFWTSTLGLWLTISQRRQTASTSQSSHSSLPRMAILMPVYNETPASVFANVQAMIESLATTPHAADFDLFVLSDTTNPDIWLEEERMWGRLCQRLTGPTNVFYRRRPKNTARKAGNIADFCERWGTQYDLMIVLDADSVMDGQTMVEMARRMQDDPALGILQVPPVPVNRLSFFARLQQFSARLYSPVHMEGFSSWASFDSNYWGHNAIIRVAPFIDHCGLPTLPGVAPLGGEILSHDFVEAALMARGGWKVALAHDLAGSYEECPTTLLDYAKRDQRWCQGNLQHMRLIISEGLRPISRLHLAMGVMSYLASPLWLLFTLLGLLAMAIDGIWLGSTQERISGLVVFAFTMFLLMAPKVWSLVALAFDRPRREQFGGWSKIIPSVLIETAASVLVAPIMMLFHTRFVISTLLGEKVQWNAQNRGDGDIDFLAACRVFGPHTLTGLVGSALILFFAPGLFLWLSPILLGLTLTIPFSRILGSVELGQWLAHRRLLLIPEESELTPILKLQQRALEQHEQYANAHDRSQLLGELLSDPGFQALHASILQQTAAGLPAPEAKVREWTQAILTQGPESLSVEDRRQLLLDREALRELHIQYRVRQLHPEQSATASPM
ncbi:Glucans biosynthesis glucosyltransferase H [Planctopirus ephydatiae]|uniref:Glucans biosynthesis glucosyltransferase H n=1 Tax=Planctopirus ephydatiae TaxID=2528019 RepID=A0A518GM38_9PLAN|nr:glucans biosynthesis glucosyltransferase MdoH [Planctopirus ephydatiae]QDV29624.1 Glucans biosynthesis glucosyltransferase H [Planctopirus ephydatiae]